MLLLSCYSSITPPSYLLSLVPWPLAHHKELTVSLVGDEEFESPNLLGVNQALLTN